MTDQAELSQILAMADEAYKRADSDPRFSAAAARKIKAKVYTAAKAQIDAAATAATNSRAQRRRQLERSVFGLPDTHTATDAQSYRAAVAQVTALDPIVGEADAKAMLIRASTIGDQTLVRALVNVSFDREWADVLNAYEVENPAAKDDVEELWKARSTLDQAADGETGAWLPKPPGMRNISDYEFTRLAEPEPEPKPARRIYDPPTQTMRDGAAALAAAFEQQHVLDRSDAA